MTNATNDTEKLKLFQNFKLFCALMNARLSTESKIILDLLTIQLTREPKQRRVKMTARELMRWRDLNSRFRASEQIRTAKRELKRTKIFSSTFFEFVFDEEFAQQLFKHGYLITVNAKIYKMNLRRFELAFYIARKIFWFYSNPHNKERPLLARHLLKCIPGKKKNPRKSEAYKRRIEAALNELKRRGILKNWRYEFAPKNWKEFLNSRVFFEF